MNFKTIKSFEDACKRMGIDHAQWLKDNNHLPVDELGYKKLKIITEALNGKVMDYKDTKVWKYYPWFTAVGSGVGFSFFDYDFGYSCSAVGARLCFDSAEKATYAGKQFLQEYNEYING